MTAPSAGKKRPAGTTRADSIGGSQRCTAKSAAQARSGTTCNVREPIDSRQRAGFVCRAATVQKAAQTHHMAGMRKRREAAKVSFKTSEMRSHELRQTGGTSNTSANARLSAVSTSAMVAAMPSSAREVTPCSAIPQGTIPR